MLATFGRRNYLGQQVTLVSTMFSSADVPEQAAEYPDGQIPGENHEIVPTGFHPEG
jgi:hypothetical protein